MGIGRTLVRFASFHKVGTSSRFKFIEQHNVGLLSLQDQGDTFTEPSVYRNKKNFSAFTASAQKANKIISNEALQGKIGSSKIPPVAQRDLGFRSKIPRSADELRVARAYDAKELKLLKGCKGKEDAAASLAYAALQNEVDRRNHVLDKFGEPPSSREFQKILTRLRNSNEDESVVNEFHKRLVEENGIYPSTRLDSFMLSDEVCFPEWVHALPYRIRDQVKYGKLGITEFDEALKTRLGRLTRDERIREWNRIKKAKEYAAAQEETLTLAEVRDIRQGKRRYHWLLRKRQRRAYALRRLSLRKPDGLEAWPSESVDYSQRVAFIAQHVANGLQTLGQWPLNEKCLLDAQRRKSSNQHPFGTGELNPAPVFSSRITDLLKVFDTPAKSFKRISTKAYANRVNAVVHGDQDEYGRNFKKMKGKGSQKQKAFESLDEMHLEKELFTQSFVDGRNANISDDFYWPKHTQRWEEGLPSSRYSP